LLIPEEVTFPVNPQFKDAPDPFIAELIAIASRGIKDPGSPASALPMPLRVPAQFIEKFTHLIIATGVDPKVIEARAAALQSLSRQLPAPPEAMEGNSEANHWSAWKTSEDNVKYYFGPSMEIGVGGLTDIYLHPLMLAGNEPIDRDGGRVIMWYDASDLIVQPDNSSNAQAAREVLAIDDEAYRGLLGMDEEDAPDPAEKRDMILTALALAGQPIPDSFYLLYPEDKPDPMEVAQEQADAMALMNSVAGAPPNAGPSGGKAPATGKNEQPPGKPTGVNPAKAGVQTPARAVSSSGGR
jgi:hypothetical protein